MAQKTLKICVGSRKNMSPLNLAALKDLEEWIREAEQSEEYRIIKEKVKKIGKNVSPESQKSFNRNIDKLFDKYDEMARTDDNPTFETIIVTQCLGAKAILEEGGIDINHFVDRLNNIILIRSEAHKAGKLKTNKGGATPVTAVSTVSPTATVATSMAPVATTTPVITVVPVTPKTPVPIVAPGAAAAPATPQIGLKRSLPNDAMEVDENEETKKMNTSE